MAIPDVEILVVRLFTVCFNHFNVFGILIVVFVLCSRQQRAAVTITLVSFY